jgi:peptidoglycan hydrolase-like protein with peptidoglycan-binding domain
MQDFLDAIGLNPDGVVNPQTWQALIASEP